MVSKFLPKGHELDTPSQFTFTCLTLIIQESNLYELLKLSHLHLIHFRHINNTFRINLHFTNCKLHKQFYIHDVAFLKDTLLYSELGRLK